MAALARLAGRLADAGAHSRTAAELAMHIGYPVRLNDILDEAGLWCAATGQYADPASDTWGFKFLRIS
jgi:hypothetical protein